MPRRTHRVVAAAAVLLAAALSVSVVGAAWFATARLPSAEADVRAALESGAYARAVELATTFVNEATSRSGAESLENARASDLLVDALTRAGKAADDRTVSRAEQVVAVKERQLGAAHAELAVSLHNLGTVRVERGEFTEAVSLHQRALSIRSTALGADDPAIADSLDRLAVPLIRLQQFDDARRALQRSLAIREAHAEGAPRELARTLELLALLHRYSGNYAAATAPLERALTIRRQLGLATHPETTSAVSLRGDVLYLGGDITAAQRAWQDALGLAESRLGREHPAVPPLLRRLAMASDTLGDLSEKRNLLKQALEVGDATLAPCHPETAGILNDLATSSMFVGEYAEARALYERALTTREHCLGLTHALTATIIYNQATLAARAGDYAEAERLYQKAVRIWSSALGANHPYVATGLDGLADVLTTRGQPRRARDLYGRALEIRRKALGPDHPDVAWTLTNLARTIAVLGDVPTALADVERAIEIHRRGAGSVDPDQLARMLHVRGELEMKQRSYEAARATFEETLAVRERIFGATHPLTAEARALIASAQFALGSYSTALEAALDAEQAGRDHLRFTIRYLPERQSLLYAANRPRGLDLALSVVVGQPVGDPSSVLDAVIRSRALVLDELASRSEAASADTGTGALQHSTVAARQRFANLMLRSVLGEDVPRALLDSARSAKEAAERTLAERSAAERVEQTRARAGLDDVRRMLPPGSALVSFAHYDRTMATRNGGPVRPAAPAYVAFVVRADRTDLSAIPLGASATIDRLIRDWRAEILGGAVADAAQSTATQSYRVSATALRRSIWDPVARHLAGIDKVFIVPDGSISVVAFDALPVSGTKYLVESGPTIHYLSAERDLVDLSQASTHGQGLLALGGASFGSAAAARPASSAATRSGCGAAQSVRFEPLPGTRAEVAEIDALWKAAAGSDGESSILSGRDATESRFTRQASGRRVLHIATHGFFLGNGCSPAVPQTRSVGGLAPRSGDRLNAPPLENPLTLSGLAMAGANRRAVAGASQEDGILTAEEVTALDLRGVEWAVLSACDTGLGEVRAGEGVLGLRRAFQIAGVRTIVMSLWAVDDVAVREWMRALYAGRLQRGLATADAVHQAHLEILRKRRARGTSTHPFFWAGFVAAGDWR